MKNPNPGDIVELNSGSPRMTVLEVSAPGRDPESEDVIAWWLGPSDEPQIARFDVRMLTLVVRPSGPMPEPRYRWGWGQQP
jgi:hypothetical protein